MWSGFDISLQVLAAEFNLCCFYILTKEYLLAVTYFCIHIKLFKDCISVYIQKLEQLSFFFLNLIHCT